jgi:hypothetical protein
MGLTCGHSHSQAWTPRCPAAWLKHPGKGKIWEETGAAVRSTGEHFTVLHRVSWAVDTAWPGVQ